MKSATSPITISSVNFVWRRMPNSILNKILNRWIRKYSEKGTISLMRKSDTTIPGDSDKIRSAENIETLKGQMLNMQMEIDILKETINV